MLSSQVLNQIWQDSHSNMEDQRGVRLTRHGSTLFPSNENLQKTKAHIDIFIYPYIHTLKSNIFSATFPEVQKKQQRKVWCGGRGMLRGETKKRQASRSRWPRQIGRSQRRNISVSVIFLSLSLSVSIFFFLFCFFCNFFDYANNANFETIVN